MEESGACGFMAIAQHIYNDTKQWLKNGVLDKLQTALKAQGEKITKRNAHILKLCTKCLKDNAIMSCIMSKADFRLTDQIRKSDFLIYFQPLFDMFVFGSGYFKRSI